MSTPIWNHPAYLETLTPKCVAIGNAGTLVFTDIQGENTFMRTLSSSDKTPAKAVSQSEPSASRTGCVVASADGADVRVSLAYVKQGTTSPVVPTLSVSSFGGHDWTYTFPFTVTEFETALLGVGVSRDGQTIVATAFKRAGGFKQAIAVFHPGSAVPVAYSEVPVYADPFRYALSADGSTLYVLSFAFTLIFDTRTETMIYWADHFETVNAGMAISGDGSKFAKTFQLDKRIEIYSKEQGTYTLYATYHQTGVGQCYKLAFSDDGNTLVAGYWDTIYPSQKATVLVLDVETATPQMVFKDEIVGSGPYWNFVQDISIARDGMSFAVGLTGSASGTIPQLHAYSRDPVSKVWSKVVQAVLSGSVMGVSISADGSKVAVANIRGQQEAPTGGGEISLFQLGSLDVTLDGVPHAGKTVSIRYQPSTPAVPGTKVSLLAAQALAVHPVAQPGGVLWLERVSSYHLGEGVIDQTGGVTFPLTVPSAVGASNFNQVLCLSAPRVLSKTFVKITALP